MKRRMSLALITTLTIGTMLLLTNANAASKWNTHDDDSIDSAEIRLGVHQDLTETRREIRAERRVRHDRILERREREAAATWTPEPDPTTTYTAYPEYHGCLSSEDVAGYLRGAGFPEDIIPTMLIIVDRESGGCPGALNPVSSACGLTQIWPYREGCLDPARNAAMAYAKYVAAGYSLSPWALTAP